MCYNLAIAGDSNMNTTPTFTQLGAYCVGATPVHYLLLLITILQVHGVPATISAASQGTTTYIHTYCRFVCNYSHHGSLGEYRCDSIFSQLGSYCVGATPGILPTTSNNNISQVHGVLLLLVLQHRELQLILIPPAGQCYNGYYAGIGEMLISPDIYATRSLLRDATRMFYQVLLITILQVPGILLRLVPATPGTTTYSFTPTTGQCATTATMDVTINPIAIFDLELTLCNGDSIIIGSKTFKETGLFSETHSF
ncbi:MAG: hypothetical protein IPP71_20230 [Bacteroidetes bacterium]|nr:hypothetical protein [Bacteroidota bacterium]